MNLQDKVVIVTGAAQGIGRASALEFIAVGAKVIANYRRIQPEPMAGETMFVQADVSTEEGVAQLFDQAMAKFGRVDILINNAADSKTGDFLTGEIKLWQELYQNNVVSAVLCSQQFVRINKGQQEKKIINIGSLFGFDTQGYEQMMEYSATKAALHNFTKTLAKLLAPNVLVNAVAPGYTLTAQWRKRSSEFKEACVHETLIGRLVRPEEIAAAVLFLAQNDAMTGTILVVDGGLSLA